MKNKILKNKTLALALTSTLLLISMQSYAGDFVELPSTDPLRVLGTAINDPLSLGYDVTFSGLLPSQFIELASQTTQVIDVDSGLVLGNFFDRVYRDSTDNKLVFASRIELTQTDGTSYAPADFDNVIPSPFEVNDIQRSGFSGFTAAVSWWDATGYDYRLKSAARSAQGFYRTDNGTTLPDVYDPDIVDMNTDTSGPEGNNYSGWYFIKTDAIDFHFVQHAANIYSGNQDVSSSTTDRWIAGYAPMQAVPEPNSISMILMGLGLMGYMIRRRSA